MYVAQPPLYKLTRRKKEMYIFDDDDLDRRLEEMGAASRSLDVVQEGEETRTISGEALRRLSTALAKIEDLVRALERRHVSVGGYFAAMAEDGSLPTAIVTRASDLDNPTFVRGDEGIAEFIAAEEALLGREVRVYEEGDENGSREGADVLVTRIYEHKEFESQGKVLRDMHIDPHHWEVEGDVRYRLGSEGSESLELGTLQEVLEQVRKAGQRGVDVTRYKGLGEMNPDQLWDTTMDPEHRILLRVSLADAAEADRLFSLLMGESVEPRRQFVEQHALEVTNLDV